MKRFLLVIAALGTLGFGLVYCGEDHQRYLAFDQQRDAWHRKCDVYIGKASTDIQAKECQQELAAMSAYAKRQGWQQ